MSTLILSKDKFPTDIGGGLESDLTLEDRTPLTNGKWCVAIANKARLTKEESKAFRLKLEELTGLKWEHDSVSKFIFHYSKENLMAKKKAKKNKGEQLDLIDVGPKNGKVIIAAVRVYKNHQANRLASLKKEIEAKEKVLALVKEADLKRLKDGVIKFTYDKVTIKVTPQDDLISIKEETTKKKKTSTKGQVEVEEKEHEDQIAEEQGDK